MSSRDIGSGSSWRGSNTPFARRDRAGTSRPYIRIRIPCITRLSLTRVLFQGWNRHAVGGLPPTRVNVASVMARIERWRGDAVTVAGAMSPGIKKSSIWRGKPRMMTSTARTPLLTTITLRECAVQTYRDAAPSIIAQDGGGDASRDLQYPDAPYMEHSSHEKEWINASQPRYETAVVAMESRTPVARIQKA